MFAISFPCDSMNCDKENEFSIAIENSFSILWFDCQHSDAQSEYFVSSLLLCVVVFNVLDQSIKYSGQGFGNMRWKRLGLLAMFPLSCTRPRPCTFSRTDSYKKYHAAQRRKRLNCPEFAPLVCTIEMNLKNVKNFSSCAKK